MADKIVVMHDGIVEQIGAPLDLYDRPANQFVAGFIGSPSMNFIKGRVTFKGTPRVETESGVALPLPSTSAGLEEGQKVVYGLRPEHVRIDPAGVPAEVVVTEPTGSEILVMARLGDPTGSAGTRQEITCLFRERLSFTPGEIIRIVPQTSSTHLFEDGTGKRL